MTKSILLAEDSLDDEFYFRRVLHSAGVQNPVFAVHDGVQAIEYLNGEGNYQDRQYFPNPGILFLDLNMPRVNGVQVLAWLRNHALLEEILIIVLTIGATAKELEDVYHLGADSFLVKPFTCEDLENLVQHFPGYWIRAGHRHDSNLVSLSKMPV